MNDFTAWQAHYLNSALDNKQPVMTEGGAIDVLLARGLDADTIGSLMLAVKSDRGLAIVIPGTGDCSPGFMTHEPDLNPHDPHGLWPVVIKW